MGCLGGCILGWCTGVRPLMAAAVHARCNNPRHGSSSSSSRRGHWAVGPVPATPQPHPHPPSPVRPPHLRALPSAGPCPPHHPALPRPVPQGLESLNENLTELKCELIFRNETIMFRPSVETIRDKYYQKMKEFIAYPASFRGVADSNIFRHIPDRNGEVCVPPSRQMPPCSPRGPGWSVQSPSPKP